MKQDNKLIIYSLTIIASFGLLVQSLPAVQASETAELDVTLFGDSVIDLNSLEKDRLIRVYAQFTNFEISDKYFFMKIIQSSTGQTVAESMIKVYSTSNGLIDFNSFIGYMVNDQDICMEEHIKPVEKISDCYDVMTGNYEIQISTKDGSLVGSETFTIVDTRLD